MTDLDMLSPIHTPQRVSEACIGPLVKDELAAAIWG